MYLNFRESLVVFLLNSQLAKKKDPTGYFFRKFSRDPFPALMISEEL
jgi:hypothetical protein